MKARIEIPANQKFAFSINEAMAATGLGRTRIYEEIKLGQLTAVKAGKRTLIPAGAIEKWIANLPTVAAVRTRSA